MQGANVDAGLVDDSCVRESHLSYLPLPKSSDSAKFERMTLNVKISPLTVNWKLLGFFAIKLEYVELATIVFGVLATDSR